MSLVKVGSKHQVVIPKDVRTKLNVHPGDYVEIAIHKNQAVLKPKKLVDVPYTDEMLSAEIEDSIRQGLKDVEEGEISGTFNTPAEVQAHLDSLKTDS